MALFSCGILSYCIQGVLLREMNPVMENEMGKKMENDMETVIKSWLTGLYGLVSISGLPRVFASLI